MHFIELIPLQLLTLVVPSPVEIMVFVASVVTRMHVRVEMGGQVLHVKVSLSVSCRQLINYVLIQFFLALIDPNINICFE